MAKLKRKPKTKREKAPAYQAPQRKVSLNGARTLSRRKSKLIWELWNINPKQAQFLIDNRAVNREINAQFLAEYQAMREAGEWMVDSGEVVKIDQLNRVFDGLTRLQMIVDSGKALECWVCRDIPHGAHLVVDSGRPRTVSDAFKIAGERHYAMLAAACRPVFGLTGPAQVPYVHLFPIQAINLMRPKGGHGNLRKSVAMFAAQPFNQIAELKISPSYMAGLHYLFARRSKTLADQFFHRLATGEQLKGGTPVRQLQRLFIADAVYAKSDRYHPSEVMRMTIHAWAATRDPKLKFQILLDADEGGPMVIV